MKKRILSVMLMASVLLGTTACGGGNETPAAITTEGTKETTTAVQTTIKTEAESKEEITETTAPESEAETTAPVSEAETTEQPEAYKQIGKIDYLQNGNLVFEMGGMGYVYDTVDNTLFSYDSSRFDKLCATNGKLAIFYNESSYALYNLEKQEILASKDTNGMSPLCQSLFIPNDFTSVYWMYSDYTPIYRANEGSDGKAFEFGIMDKNGEWVIPFGSDYKVSDCTNLDFVGANLCGQILYLWKGEAGKIYYPETDEYLDEKIHNAFGDQSNDYFPFMNNGDEYLFENLKDAISDKIIKFNIKTGDYSVIHEGEFISYGDMSVFFNEDYSSVFGIDDNLNKYEYNLSDYSVDKILCMNENYIVFKGSNSDFKMTTFVLDRDGNSVFEPGESMMQAFISGDKVAFMNYDNEASFVDLKTGDVDKREALKYNLVRFDYESGLMLVKVGGVYYFADIADPDTLINPFEFVNN